MEMTRLIANNRAELIKGDVEVGTRARVALSMGTRLSAETCMTTPVASMTLKWLRDHGVGALQLVVAGLFPAFLFRAGIATGPEALLELELDALYLAQYPRIASEARALYGPESCRTTWLRNASDAVALAGSEAGATLEATLERLLAPCEGRPTEAEAVLACTVNAGLCVRAFGAAVLIATGIDAAGLVRGGVLMSDVLAMGATPQELNHLGFRALPSLG